MTLWVYYLYAEFYSETPLLREVWIQKSHDLGQMIHDTSGVKSVSLTTRTSKDNKTHKALLVVTAERQIEDDVSPSLTGLTRLEIFHMETRVLGKAA